jgi:gliding motility-associated-like protein
LVLTSPSGCISQGSVKDTLTVYPASVAAFESPAELQEQNAEVRFVNKSVNALSSAWDFGDNKYSTERNPDHVYKEEAPYLVVLRTVSPKGCLDSTIKRIEVLPTFTYFVPNAFTPNADGINDRFNGKGDEFSNYKMLIFDRWGELIFSTSDKDAGWDGRANGGNELAQIGVYIYKIALTDFKGTNHQYEGSVTLVR